MASGVGVRHGSISPATFKPLTPEEYTRQIQQYVTNSYTTLFPGHHFDRLAAFLREPFKNTNRSPSPRRDYTPPFDFVTAYLLDETGRKAYRPPAPREVKADADRQARSLIFLRGKPSPEWLAYVGAAYNIDPEFFNRHLDFLCRIGRKDHYIQPSLVSTSRHIVQLSYMTVGEFNQYNKEKTLDALRSESDKGMRTYLDNLAKHMTMSLPPYESMVRSHHVLDTAHFAIEQYISMCFTRTASGWTVLIWLDTGRPLTADQPGPWAKALRTNQSQRRTTFLPWIQEFSHAALHPKKLSISPDHVEFLVRELQAPTNTANPNGRADSRGPKGIEVEQSASLMHLDYGKTLDPKTMWEDPFYATHEIYHLCAVSESQFLNTLESKVEAEIDRELRPDQNVSPTNVIYFQRLLEGRADRMRRTIKIIQAQIDHPWTRVTDSDSAKANAAAHSLLADYNDLLNRAELLSSRCKSRLNILMNHAGIVESNKAIEQAKEVTKLTRLAFVFIPLSYTSSFFGMNLGPFADHPAYGLWLYFAVSAPVVIFLLAVMTWNLPQLFKRITGLEKKKKERRETEDEE